MHSCEYLSFKVHVVEDQSPINAGDDDGILARAKRFTRRPMYRYSSRMKWDQTNFHHLLIPVDESPSLWDERMTLASDPGSITSGS